MQHYYVAAPRKDGGDFYMEILKAKSKGKIRGEE